MAATERLLTGRSSEFADVLEWLGDIDVLAPATSVQFDNLDGDVDNFYVLFFSLYANAGTQFFSLLPNGINTGMHYAFVGGSTGGPIAGSGVAGGLMEPTADSGGQGTRGVIEVFAKRNGHYRQASGDWNRDADGASVVIKYEFSGTWSDVATNITSLVLQGSAAGAIGAGSHFSLYRMRKAG